MNDALRKIYPIEVLSIEVFGVGMTSENSSGNVPVKVENR